MKNIVLLILILIFTPIKTALADPLINAQISLSSHKFDETAVHTITFKSAQELNNGKITIVVSAKDTTVRSNDGIADLGNSIDASGFDLNNLPPRSVYCRGGTNAWQAPIIAPSTTSLSGEHEIICPFLGSINKNSLITIIIGDEKNKLINPKPLKNHQSGIADIYPIRVNISNEKGKITDTTTFQAEINETITTSSGFPVKATVGGEKMLIYGFTSPKALIKLQGISIKSIITADQYGYFEFNKIRSPYKSQEICLISYDEVGRLSLPVCLSPFSSNKMVKIGPIIMSPTISINQNYYMIGDIGNLSGKTIPNSVVKIAFFKEAFAAESFSLPLIETQSDQYGSYSINIPTNTAGNYRVFTQARFENDPSAKSLTLNVGVNPSSFGISKLITTVIFLIKLYLFQLILSIIMIGILRYIVSHLMHPHIIARSRSLMVINAPIVLAEPHPIVLIKNRIKKING